MQGATQINSSQINTQINTSEINSAQRSDRTLLGQVIGGRYQVLEMLGLGGFGKTYISADLQRPGTPKCVLKHLHFSSQDEEMLKQARRMFAQEATALERLGKHEQIPQLLAYFEEAGEFYLVQEFIPGHPLSREIPEGTALSEAETVELLTDVLGILDFVHQEGVIHRDLKPENLIRRSSDRRVVMIDFGAVKTIGAQMQAVDNRSIPVYTTGYAASEQCLGKPQFNSDLYSLGMIALQCLTGSHPTFIEYDPKTGDALWQKTLTIDFRLTRILELMTAYRSRDRYTSACEVLNALGQLPQNSLVEDGFVLEDFALDSPTAIHRSDAQANPIDVTMAQPPTQPGQQHEHSDQYSVTSIVSQLRSPIDETIGKTIELAAQAPTLTQRKKLLSWPRPMTIAAVIAAASGSLMVFHPDSPFRRQLIAGTWLGQTVLTLSPSTKLVSPEENLPISDGDRLLLKGENMAERQTLLGSQSNGRAISLTTLKNIRSRFPSDPESLIYLNNLEATGPNQTNPTHTIAAVLPLSQFPEASAEVLRGVAQAQTEANKKIGISGKKIRILLADDRNQPDFARKIAQRLSEMPELLGVIGHGGSDTTLAAADIYKANQLVTVSPLSSAVQLSGYSPYLFRTMPSDRLPAKALGQQMERLKKRRAIVFFNSTNTYSQSLKSEFKNALFYNQSDASTPTNKSAKPAEIVAEIDLAQPDFNPAMALKEAMAKNAEVIILANGQSDNDRAMLIMQLNQNRLPILAGDALYTDTVRQVGQVSGAGLTLAIPAQQIGLIQSPFQRQATKLWQQPITWRSALSYDATLALTGAIAQASALASNTSTSEISIQRDQIRTAIARSDFQVMGSVLPIRFTESGDPRHAIQLVKLSRNPRTHQPEFIPIPSP